MDTFALQGYVVLLETGSFTKAAERVGRTQSALSQQIARLEKWVGKPLIVRARQGLSPTPEGEIFLSYARRILNLEFELADRLATPELEGEVRFGLPEDFASVVLADVLAEFARIHPRILLNVACDLTLNLFERFQKQEFDLVLVKMLRPQDFPNGLEVWSEPLEWVGQPDGTLPSGPIPLVLAPTPCVYRTQALKALEKAGTPWRLTFSSPSYAGTTAAVRAGMGVTVLPRTMIPSGLSPLEGIGLPPLEHTHVSLLKHHDQDSAVNSFEGFVLKKLH